MAILAMFIYKGCLSVIRQTERAVSFIISQLWWLKPTQFTFTLKHLISEFFYPFWLCCRHFHVSFIRDRFYPFLEGAAEFGQWYKIQIIFFFFAFAQMIYFNLILSIWTWIFLLLLPLINHCRYAHRTPTYIYNFFPRSLVVPKWVIWQSL